MKVNIQLDGFETLNAINSGTLAALTESCVSENRSRTITSETTINPPEESKSKPKQDKKKEIAEAPEDNDDSKLTLKEVQNRTAKVNKLGHMDEVKKILVARGAKKLSDLNPEDYEEFLNEVEALV